MSTDNLRYHRFRAKTMDTNEWVYGDLIHDRFDLVYIQYLDNLNTDIRLGLNLKLFVKIQVRLTLIPNLPLNRTL